MTKKLKYYNPADSIIANPINFKATVREMTAKGIIMNMVEALREPMLNVRMDSFGKGRDLLNGKYICYGCAATNSICRISKVVFDPGSIDSLYSRAKFLGINRDFLECFEAAINLLRKGTIERYNLNARWEGFASIKDHGVKLPFLDDNYTEADLECYVQLANAQ